MGRQATMQAHQIALFAQFLKEQPGFSPLLTGPDALVSGFQFGGNSVGIADMEQIVASRPHFDAKEAALLLAPLASRHEV